MLILVNPKKPTFTILLHSIDQTNMFFGFLKTGFGSSRIRKEDREKNRSFAVEENKE